MGIEPGKERGFQHLAEEEVARIMKEHRRVTEPWVAIDTNVFISATFWGGESKQLINAVCRV
jgi:hypothetical protein